MSGLTRIEWADRVWNPITGCTKCSPACDNCYAERMSKRLAGRCGYPADDPFRVTLHADKLFEPMRWKKPARIFVGSMTDLFHPDVPFALLDRLFGTMSLAKWHTFLVLTKRPERMAEYFATRGDELKGHPDWPLPNVWLGTTIWDQESAERNLFHLLSTPAAKRFVSVEPMLGPVDMGQWIGDYDCHACGKRFWAGIDGCKSASWHPREDDAANDTPGCPYCQHVNSGDATIGQVVADDYAERRLDWIICGGETGPGARPMHPDWPRNLRDQCQASGVPFFFKQWGEFNPAPESWKICEADGSGHPDVAWPDGKLSWGKSEDHGGLGTRMVRVGKAKAGRVLDGRTWEEMPNA